MNVAFIPVRGGSKSIPLKNIKYIAGKPLVYWTLEAACQCSSIDKVFVSTDDERIRRVVEKFASKKLTVIGRSPETATDVASTESALLEFAESHEFSYCALIQATSPLLRTEDLEKGLDLVLHNEYDSVLSAVKQKRFIWEIKDGLTQSINYDYWQRPRRQEFDGYYVENGAFYITSRELLLSNKNRISGRIGLYEMGEESYYEIDEKSDWTIVEQLLYEQRTHYNKSRDNQRIDLFITDCDGVLTDGGMYYSSSGEMLKRFNTRDGMGIALLKEKGIKTVLISGENSKITKIRAEKLGFDEIYLGIKNKMRVVEDLLIRHRTDFSRISYIGDDINDLDVIKAAAIGACPADAHSKVKAECKIVTKASGGSGAVRELIDLILE